MKDASLISGIILSIIIAWASMIVLFAGTSDLPYIIAIILTLMSIVVLCVLPYGKNGLKDHIGRFLRWKVPIQWYLIAILLPLSIEIISLAVFSLAGGKLPPISPGNWNMSYESRLVIGVVFMAFLATGIAGFTISYAIKKPGVFKESLVFTALLIASMALVIVAIILDNTSNVWLFIGLIPAALIALWIIKNTRESLLPASLFIFCFLAFELMSPANWFLSYEPGPMILGGIFYYLIAAVIIFTDNVYFSPGKGGEKHDKTGFRANIPLVLAAIVIIAAIVSLAYLATVSNMVGYPEPTGPYKVGKTSYDWVDQNRSEIATGNTTKRELMVYIWYPADVPPGTKEAPVTDAKTASAIYASNTFSLGFLSDVSEHAYSDMPVSSNSSRYPVLIMSHGDSSSPLMLAITAADLASHGYIVVGISHTYNAHGTVFPDGRVIGRNDNYSLIQGENYNISESFYENSWDWNHHNEEVEDREAADVSFVLDKVEQLNESDSLFKDRIDMGRVGAFGHSLGGAVAILSEGRDDRIKAAADLDGATFHNTTTQKPTMLFLRGSVLDYDRPYDEAMQRLLTPEQFNELKEEWDGYEMRVYTNPPTSYFVGINGAEHANFKDFGALNIPIDTGTIDGKYATHIVDSYLLAFFDKHLNGVDSPLIDGQPAYPDVVFKGHVNGTPISYKS